MEDENGVLWLVGGPVKAGDSVTAARMLRPERGGEEGEGEGGLAFFGFIFLPGAGSGGSKVEEEDKEEGGEAGDVERGGGSDGDGCRLGEACNFFIELGIVDSLRSQD